MNTRYAEPPFHYMSLIAIIGLDISWAVFETFTLFVSPLFIVVLSLLVGAIGALAVYYIQTHMAKDEHPQGLVKAIVMGIIAGVPFMVTSTVIGLAIVVWLAAMSVMKPQPAPEAPADAEKRKREADIIDDDPEQVLN